MNNEEFEINDKIQMEGIVAINLISGTYTTPFWDCIYAMNGKAETIENLVKVIETLQLADKIKEAMMLIHTLYDLIGFVYPEEIAMIEKNDAVTKIFIDEFVLDGQDLMSEYRQE